jgi:hypothetical protein
MAFAAVAGPDRNIIGWFHAFGLSPTASCVKMALQIFAKT